MYLLTQLTRLELGDFLLDLAFELRGDYGPPGCKGALERLDAEATETMRRTEGGSEDEDWMYEEDPQLYSNPQASEWAGERAKFADFLATLSKMSTGIGESQFFEVFTPLLSPVLALTSLYCPSVLFLRVFPCIVLSTPFSFSYLLSMLNMAAGRMHSLYRSHNTK